MKKTSLLLLLSLLLVLAFAATALAAPVSDDPPVLTKITINDFTEAQAGETTGQQLKKAFADADIDFYFDNTDTPDGNGTFEDLVSIQGLGDNEKIGYDEYKVTVLLDHIGGTELAPSVKLTINGKKYSAKTYLTNDGYLALVFLYAAQSDDVFISKMYVTGYKAPQAGMTVKECLKNIDVEYPCTLATRNGKSQAYFFLNATGNQLPEDYVFQGGEQVTLAVPIENEGVRYDSDKKGSAILKVYVNGKLWDDCTVFGGEEMNSCPTANIRITVGGEKIQTINVTGLILPQAGMTVAQCKANVKVDAPCKLNRVDFSLSNGIAYESKPDDYVFQEGQRVLITVAIEKDGVTYDLNAAGDAVLLPYLNGALWSGAEVYGGDRSLPTINYHHTVTASFATPSYVDVKPVDWYFTSVQAASEMGLVNGMGDGTFQPQSNLTYAQAVKLAACMNQRYAEGKVSLTNGSGAWYDSYIEYCLSKGIFDRAFAEVVRKNANTNIDRKTYVYIFANALPDAALAAKNSIPDGSLPDVKKGATYYDSIYKLYRAGVLNGNDAKGTFAPDKPITRAEVSAIVVRMMDAKERKAAPADLGK